AEKQTAVLTPGAANVAAAAFTGAAPAETRSASGVSLATHAVTNGGSLPPVGASSTPRTETGIPIPTVIEGTEHIAGEHLTLLYETKKCIHARFCVTGAPKVFL